jgi:hypothetical protein
MALQNLPTVERQGTSQCITVMLLSKFTGYRNVRFRQVAVEGFAKLMLQGVITDHKILGTLVILPFLPISDPTISRCLEMFFKFYLGCGNSSQHVKILSHAFIPTLQLIIEAPDVSPLSQIDPIVVGRWMLGFMANAYVVICPTATTIAHCVYLLWCVCHKNVRVDSLRCHLPNMRRDLPCHKRCTNMH